MNEMNGNEMVIVSPLNNTVLNISIVHTRINALSSNFRVY